MSVFKIRRSTCQGILAELGYVGVADYTDVRLLHKITSIGERITEVQTYQYRRTLEAVLGAIDRKDTLVVVDDAGMPPVKPQEPESAPEQPRSGRKAREQQTVKAFTIKYLSNYSCEHPLTFEKLIAKLVGVTEREPDELRPQVTLLLKKSLKREGHDLKKNANGYWIEIAGE